MKTSELKDRALDWAVAVADGRWQKWIRSANPKRLGTSIMGVGFDEHGVLHAWSESKDRFEPYSPSTNWEQAGPIIEREKIDLRFSMEGSPNRNRGIGCNARINYVAGGQGPTPLIAAMRGFVASKLGDEVDVPAELI